MQTFATNATSFDHSKASLCDTERVAVCFACLETTPTCTAPIAQRAIPFRTSSPPNQQTPNPIRATRVDPFCEIEAIRLASRNPTGRQRTTLSVYRVLGQTFPQTKGQSVCLGECLRQKRAKPPKEFRNQNDARAVIFPDPSPSTSARGREK